MWRRVPFENVVTVKRYTDICNMAKNSAVPVCVKLGSVQGHEGKENHVLLCGLPAAKYDSHVIFFGGDVQDYKENMESYLPHKDFVKWNLEATAEILQSKFPQSLIWVIRPKKLLNNTYSTFSNFLASIFNGAPDQTVKQDGQGSWFHLKELWLNSVKKGIDQLNGLTIKQGNGDNNESESNVKQSESNVKQSESNVKQIDSNVKQIESESNYVNQDRSNVNQHSSDVKHTAAELTTAESSYFEQPPQGSNCEGSCLEKSVQESNSESSNLEETVHSKSNDATNICDIESIYNLPLHIIGFSKGCVVLNQLLYDLNQALSDDSTNAFMQQVETMTWLDGGHSGGLNTWVIKQDIISYLKQTKIKVKVHVTPYQVKDPMRNWIGKEQRKFTFLLRKLEIPVEETLHFNELEASLENHFNVLTEFKK